jgi:hypothetical protein
VLNDELLTNVKDMKTKVISLAIIFLLTIPQGFSQNRPKGDTGVHLGLLGGGSLQTIYGKDYEGNTLDYNFKIGFHAGVNANIPILPDFYLQPGLLFSAKGYSQEILVGTNSKTNLYYVEVPLNFLFRPQAGNGHLLIGVGPYAGYGFSGNKKTDNDNDKIKFKNKVALSDLSTAAAFYRPLDAGAGILFGYEFYNGLFFQLNCQVGLLNIYPDYEGPSNNKASFRNLGFGLSAGYRF